jgi:light-harvesting complex 1 beta chain
MNTTHAPIDSSSSIKPTKERASAATVIFVPAFVLFLAIALVGQTLGKPWRSWLPGAESAKSVTGGVKAAVYTFMSHLQ